MIIRFCHYNYPRSRTRAGPRPWPPSALPLLMPSYDDTTQPHQQTRKDGVKMDSLSLGDATISDDSDCRGLRVANLNQPIAAKIVEVIADHVRSIRGGDRDRSARH